MSAIFTVIATETKVTITYQAKTSIMQWNVDNAAKAIWTQMCGEVGPNSTYVPYENLTWVNKLALLDNFIFMTLTTLARDEFNKETSAAATQAAQATIAGNTLTN